MKIWFTEDQSTLISKMVQQPAKISSAGINIPADIHNLSAEESLLVPVAHHRRTLALCMVPPGVPIILELNGLPLGEGVYPLAHADCLRVGNLTAWVAAATSAEEVAYSPAAHGEDVFCARSKMRLREGQPIVVCPGIGCGRLFTAQAYALQLPCPNCRHNPTAGEWMPEVNTPEQANIDELLNLVM